MRDSSSCYHLCQNLKAKMLLTFLRVSNLCLMFRFLCYSRLLIGGGRSTRSLRPFTTPWPPPKIGGDFGCSRRLSSALRSEILFFLLGRRVRLQIVLALLLFASSLHGQSTKDNPSLKSANEARGLFVQARDLLGQGNLVKAREATLQGIKLSPQSVDGYNLLGIIYSQQKDYSQSLAAFQQALKLNPSSSETHNNLGKSYFAQQKLEPAEKEFRTALRLGPHHRDSNYNLGLVLMAESHPEQAIPFFERVIPPDLGTLLNLTQALIRSGQVEKGLALASQISDQDKKDVQLHFSLGVLLASEKQYGRALAEFEIADGLSPRTFEILNNLGQAYLRNGNYPLAETTLERALALKPDSTNTMYLLGQAYSAQRKHVSALELLVRARKLSPQDTDILFLLARLFMSQSFYDDAIQLLEEGVRIAPQRADLHASLGECYFSMVKLDKAIQEFETLIKLDPSARSYGLLGVCYRQIARYDDARKYLTAGIKVDPRDPMCLYNLGYMENKQGNLQEAELLLNQALQADPNYGDALYELATVKMAERKYREAIPLLRRSTQLASKPALAYYKLSIAERRLNQVEAAEKDLKIFQTLSKDPAPSPYPFQGIFDYLSERAAQTDQAKITFDLQELLAELKRQPEKPRTLYLVAESYLKLGRPREAMEIVARLDMVSVSDFRTTMGTGVLLARYRMYPEAIDHFQRALAADPLSNEARYNLANAYFQTRDYSRALELLQQVSNQTTNDDAYYALLGDTYARSGRAPEATKALQQAISKRPDKDQYYLSLALIQLRAGKTSTAEETLRKGLTRTPNSGKVQWGMGVLSVAQGKTSQAEEHLKICTDLIPEWPISHASLGIFYYITGQITKVSETLDRYQELSSSGGLNVKRIREILASTPATEAHSSSSKPLPAESRQQFLQLALALVDQEN